MPNTLKLLGQNVPEEALSEDERSYLRRHAVDGLKIHDIWRLMDGAWEEQGAGFTPERAKSLGAFYASPVWLLNGLFTQSDPESQGHRDAIAAWVVRHSPKTVVDYGGGFGTLARKLAKALPSSSVIVVDPYPSRLALHLAKAFDNLRYSVELPDEADIIIAQDVLEHVTDPLAMFGELVKATRVGGHIVTANCFQPLIKCHYPGVLHFYFSFHVVAPSLGCDFEGVVPGAEHGQIFRRSGKPLAWRRARMLEKTSTTLYPALRFTGRIKRSVGRLKSAIRR